MTDKKIVALVEAKGKDRIYEMEDGSVEKWSNGTVAWRNNNPGNLKFEYAGSADKTVKTSRTKEKALSDAQSKYDGIVALDQWGNAVFETLDAGRTAKIKLLTNHFEELTVHQMIRKYSVPDYSGKTNWDSQEATIYKIAEVQGVNLRNKKIADMSEKELSALADGISKFEGWKEGDVTVIREKNHQTSVFEIDIDNSLQFKYMPTISQKHQQFVQQCEDKLVAICNERGITADSPQDFKNIAAAIATKGIIEQGMDKVEKATIDGSNFYIGSYSPHTKIVSVNVHEAVHIPVHESMEKIQQLEQQTAQRTQEHQMTQEQNQGSSMV